MAAPTRRERRVRRTRARAATSAPGARRGRSRRAAIGIVALLLAAGAVTAGLVLNRGSDLRAPTIERYQKAMLPLVTEWGKIEIQGMRPAISDLSSGEGVPASLIGGEARAWQGGLTDLRAKIQKVAAPKQLAQASALFDQSIAKYLDAAVTFEHAADGPEGDARTKAIDQGIKLASDGAAIYNRASLIIQSARHRAGLPPSPDFPDHPAGPSETVIGG
jgi:hypothetical protein